MPANYLYTYPDGTTGATQQQRTMDANGNWQFAQDPNTGRDVEGIYGGLAPGQGDYNPLAGTMAAPAGMANTGTAQAMQNPMTAGGMPSFGGQPAMPQGQMQSGAAGNVGPGGQLAQGSVNPYLASMGNNLTTQMLNAFNRTTLPGIGSAAAGQGGYGSSRQGVLEANALNDFSQNQGAALTSLYGNGYNTGLQYDLGVRNNNTANAQAANSYDLGLRNNDLGYANLDSTINNNNLNYQLQGASLGLQANNALQQGNALGLQAGNALQGIPTSIWQTFNGAANSVGNGFASQQNQNPYAAGNPLSSALGGAQLGSQLWGSANNSGQAQAAGQYGAGSYGSASTGLSSVDTTGGYGEWF